MLSISDALAGQAANAITVIGGVFVTAISLLAAWGLSVLQKRLNIDTKSQAFQTIESGIANGMNAGVHDLVTKLAAGDKVANPRAFVTDIARAYAEPKVQGELGRVGIDPATLRDRIDARVAGKLLDPAVNEALAAASQGK